MTVLLTVSEITVKRDTVNSPNWGSCCTEPTLKTAQSTLTALPVTSTPMAAKDVIAAVTVILSRFLVVQLQ